MVLSKDHLTDDEVAEIHEMIGRLKAKERSLESKLVHDTMTTQAARDLSSEICGLLRAIDESRDAESQDHAEFKRLEVVKRVEDARR